MDPNANLEEQLRLANDLVTAENTDPEEALPKAERLAELVIALNEWRGKGGVLPKHGPRNR
jgi:hypothetical protein